MRLAAAFLFSPLACSFFLLMLSFVGGGSGGFWIFTFSTLTGYVIIFVFGVPVYLLLARFQISGLIYYIVAGGIISLVPIFYFVVFPVLYSSEVSETQFSMAHIIQSAYILLACLITVVVFWLIARPDKRR